VCSSDLTIPANMIRIINIERFLLNMKFKECVKAKISMRITDRFVAANNVDIELRVENGRADLSHASEPELTIDIEALTKVLFLGRGDFRLAFLFPNKKMVCFDKF
jgi:predicted acetyltransferase